MSSENVKNQRKEETVTSVSDLPPTKRYIFTHNAEGKSVIHSSPPLQYNPIPKTGGAARSYAISNVPVKLSNDADINAYFALTGPTSFASRDIVIPTLQGSNLALVDLLPGQSSHFHRTVSIDYSICVMGSVECELDSGEKVTLKPGDHVIQRATMHKWTNPSNTESARILAVTLPCEPFEIPGTGGMVKEEHIAGSEAKGWSFF